MEGNHMMTFTAPDAPTQFAGYPLPRWCCRDDFPAGTLIRCIVPPDVEPWKSVLSGLLLRLSDDDAGRASRVLLTYWQDNHGARFEVQEGLLPIRELAEMYDLEITSNGKLTR